MPTEEAPAGESQQETRNVPDSGAYTRAEVDRALRWIAGGWVFGAAFCAIIGAAFGPFLIKILKADDFAFGLISATGPAAVAFLFIGSYVVERTGRTKRNYIRFVVSHRLMWLAMAAIPIVFPDLHSRWAVGVVGLIMFFNAAASNYGNAGWSVWVSSIVPKSAAGKYFAVRMTLGLWSMIFTGLLAARIIDVYQNVAAVYSWAFAIAAVCGAIDVLCHIPVAERPRPVDEAKVSIWSILMVPWGNGLFRSFALYSGVAWFTYGMMGTFVLPFCLADAKDNGLGLGVFSTNVLISTLPMVSMALVAPFWGPAIDRFGPKPVLGLGSLVAAVTPLAWLFFHRGGALTVTIGSLVLRPDIVWLVPIVQVIGGLTWPAIEQGIFYVQIRAFPEEKRSAYIASYQVVLQVASMFGAFIGGLCAEFWLVHTRDVPFFPSWFSHYQAVFLMAVVIRLAAFVFLFPRLRVEGTAELHEVAKAVASHAKSAVPALGRKRGSRPDSEKQ